MSIDALLESDNYKEYLKARLPTQGPERGARTQLARALGCQTAFVSLVLNGNAHFSLEHGIGIADFLGLAEEERQYFLLLLHRDRAGTARLRDYYQGQMNLIRRSQQNVSKRLKVTQNLELADQVEYYSNWYYSAVHVLLAVPKYRTVPKIMKQTGLSLKQVHQCLELLVRTGLALREGDKYQIGNRRIHLPPDSPMIRQHHVNWRLKVAQAIEPSHPENQSNLHFSAVFALSRKDFLKVRALLLDALASAETVIVPSPEETVGALNLDWFSLGEEHPTFPDP